VRRIASELRPSVLDHLGLVAAVEWLAQDFERRSGVHTSLHVEAGQVRLDDQLTTTAFRIVQEALTNVARHARASRVDLRLIITPAALDLEVVDDGRGISPAEASSPAALGILGLRERARSCGGIARIGSNGARGTRVSVRLPVGGTAG
jgi:signal transduction histidine kinase